VTHRMGLLVLRQFSVCKHAIACTPAGSLAFVAHGSAYSNRSPYRHDSGLPQVSGGSAPAYDFSRPPRRSQLSYGLLTRHTAERRVFLEGFDGFVTSTATPIATGWSDLCRVGIAPTEKLHLFTTHRHPTFGRLCVQAIRDAPIDPPAVERLTTAVPHSSQNVLPINEVRVS
jgi:hypothetical protein